MTQGDLREHPSVVVFQSASDRKKCVALGCFEIASDTCSVDDYAAIESQVGMKTLECRCVAQEDGWCIQSREGNETGCRKEVRAIVAPPNRMRHSVETKAVWGITLKSAFHRAERWDKLNIILTEADVSTTGFQIVEPAFE